MLDLSRPDSHYMQSGTYKTLITLIVYQNSSKNYHANWRRDIIEIRKTV